MKNAIVTGGTKGIGLAISKMLLQEDFFVTITYAQNSLAAESCRESLNSISENYEIVKADQSSKLEMQAFVNHILTTKKSVDCLVCNAGATLRKSLLETSNEDWENTMLVNVNSNVYLIRDLYSLIPHSSRIIFIGSLMAIHPHSTSLAYGVTKSALHALAKNLVKSFEDTGTTVNVIAPGFVETEWQKGKPQYIRNSIYGKTAIKRFADVEEIADAVKFCIHNTFLNGSVIEISGGYSYT